VSRSRARTPIFDLDGTLVDSDAALVAPFLALGVPENEITFGHVLADECARLGLSVDDYVRHYDVEAVQPFAGVNEMLGGLERWAVCSNKLARAGYQELDRFGWKPEVALFADAFEGSKQLVPVLRALGLEPTDVVFVGDTAHDRELARSLQITFALAGWNPRVDAEPDDVVLAHPLDVLELLVP
jgi:phosphoglycolate phosphatase-like HAD superfamily hydrolase